MSDLRELVPRPAEADLQTLDFTEPALAFGLCDAGVQVVADLDQPRPLSWVRTQERASHARMLMDATSGRIWSG
ncbi:hypothetical protein ACFZCX_28580 [Streptomyces canus]|uniref:hypothetical protein n=1 Tax=Streptomyces canus TaxID=58343 RepID=UPI0036EC3DAB